MELSNSFYFKDDFVNNQLHDLPILMKYKETEKHFYMDFHSHEGYEVYFFHEGVGFFLIEDQMFSLEGNDLILISANEAHKSSPSLDVSNTRTVIHFLPELLDDQAKETFLEIFVHNPNRRHLRLTPDQCNRLFYLFDRLHTEYAQRPKDHLLAIRVYLNELLLDIHRMVFSERNDEVGLSVKSKAHTKVEETLKYLSNHFSESVTLEKISQDLYINQYYLCHLFKKTIGITITEFLLYTRIHHAKRHLTYTNQSIADISQNVGFNSFSYFGQVFKTMTGSTPSNYRKQATSRTSSNTALIDNERMITNGQEIAASVST